MNLKLHFGQQDFERFSDFKASVKAQLGQNTYVGTNSLVIKTCFPAVLCNMLRPRPAVKQFDFTCNHLNNQLSLSFVLSDFLSFETFEASAKRQVGEEACVTGEGLYWFFPFPKALCDMLRPYPSNKVYEFELTASPDGQRRKKNKRKNSSFSDLWLEDLC